LSKYYYDETQKILNLALDGELVIGNINEIKTLLTEAFAKSDSLVVDHNDAREFDYSYLQLLVSAIKTASLTGKSFKIKDSTQQDFVDLVNDSGLNHTVFSAVK
jgi:anti-anti-sigma regulatory factor